MWDCQRDLLGGSRTMPSEAQHIRHRGNNAAGWQAVPRWNQQLDQDSWSAIELMTALMGDVCSMLDLQAPKHDKFPEKINY